MISPESHINLEFIVLLLPYSQQLFYANIWNEPVPFLHTRRELQWHSLQPHNFPPNLPTSSPLPGGTELCVSSVRAAEKARTYWHGQFGVCIQARVLILDLFWSWWNQDYLPHSNISVYNREDDSSFGDAICLWHAIYAICKLHLDIRLTLNILILNVSGLGTRMLPSVHGFAVCIPSSFIFSALNDLLIFSYTII